MDHLSLAPFSKVHSKLPLSIPKFFSYEPGVQYNWIWPDTQEQFLENNKHGLINGYSAKDISYIHNAEGFRSDEFTNSKTLVSLGCSITKGIGVPIEDTFSKIIAREYPALELVNIGLGASNNEYIFMQACTALEKLHVSLMTVTWTFIERSFYIDDKNINFFSRNFVVSDTGTPSSNDKVTKKNKYYDTVYTDNTQLLRLIFFVNQLDYLARLNGVKIVHSFVIQDEDDINSIIPFFSSNKNKVFDSIPLDRLARDNIHPGKTWNKLHADAILRELS